MKDIQKYSEDERIETICNMLISFATADYSVRATVSKKGDELDAIIVAINTLGEELQAAENSRLKLDGRVSKMMEALLQYTLMDFSTVLEVSDSGDEIDAIAVGLNTLVEELQTAKEQELLSISNLEKKAQEIMELNHALELNISKLESANKELEAFTYSVSHDLRTPLRAIHGYTKILSDDYLPNVDQNGHHMMDSIMRNAKKMGQLIDDLLAFSKVGKKELQFSEIDMNKLLASSIEELNSSLGEIKAKIITHPLPACVGDYSLLNQVITNLVSNAIKYSSAKEDPQVEINWENKENEIVYFIKDNGAGFDMKYYNKLFGVFQRLHAANEFEGTGVGLALVKRIVTRHGGRVWAEGVLDEGATFYFTLGNNKTY